MFVNGMTAQSEILARALGYPYAIPAESYALLEGGTVAPGAVAVDRASRVPLLAYGSNGAPEVLSAKLAPAPDPVPVLRTRLREFDVVYSAHISRYGSVPATLRNSPGTEVRAFVAYLTEEQLRLVSATEPNYDLARLDRPSCVLTDGERPAELWAYLSCHGCLLLDGREAALAEVEASERRFAALSQRQALERVRNLLAPGLDLASFVSSAVADGFDTARLDGGEAP